MTRQFIHSPHNPRLRRASRLREHRARLQQRRFLIDGLAELRLAMQSSLQLDELFLCTARLQDPAAAELLRALERRGVPLFELPTPLWDRLAFGHRREGIVATAHSPSPNLADIPLSDRALVVVLDRVEKPGNIGAVARTADAAGAHAVVVTDGTRDLYNPNIIRASLGTVFTLPIVAASAVETREWLRRQGLATFVATLGAPRTHFAADFSRATALVLGSEATGVGSVWQQSDMQPVAVPMLGRADSLNVSVTAAILLYEAVRQRMRS